MAEPESALIARAVTGDTEALSTLLQSHAPEMRRTLRVESRWLSRFDLDDVLQVTFLEVFLDISRFDPARKEPFGSWLLHIARNNLRDLVKEAGRAKRPPPARQLREAPRADSYVALIDVLSGSGETPSRHVAAREARQCVEGAIVKLPDIYRSVVHMCDIEGRSVSEVAETLGRSPGAVHMLRARAHDRLREILGSESRFFSRRA